ncbi:MAG TPA: hypothetical protein VGS07_07565 [Thermoanaerobaculia bacterium]|jgi:uncharacterized repeat protein (TIGR01451 family)|nr:hypothetical protein [Thermoanaerobaculia bacterium]
MNATFIKRWAGPLMVLGLWLSSTVPPLYATESADLLAQSAAPSRSGSSGATFVFTASVTNFGPDRASSVSLTAILADGLTLSDAANDYGSCMSAPAAGGGTQVDCTLGDSDPSVTKAVTFTGTAAGAPWTQLHVTFTAGSATPDPNPANNTANDDFFIDGAPVPPATPNGDTARLLFESRRTGDPDLYTRLADGTDEVNLTNNPAANDPGSPGDYVWSPDGTKIAYTSSPLSGLPEVFVMDAGGSNVMPLASTPGKRQTGLTWSPDGTKLAFAAISIGGDSGLIYIFDAVRLTVANVATFDGVVDSSPSWSPDSSRLTFMRGRLNEFNLITRSDVYVVMANASNQVQLTGTDGVLDTEPAWSTAGAQIAFLRATVDEGNGDRGPADLYVMNADGTNVRNLSNDADDDRFFSWSPDGTRIAFSRGVTHGSTFYAVDVAGGGLTPIDTSSDAARMPRWSPDGTKLTYYRVLTAQSYNAANIYVAAAEGSDTRIVGSAIEYNQNPDWSSDGARIAFTTHRGGGGIDIVNADGTGRVDLTNAPAYYAVPKWQPPVPPMTEMVVFGFVSPRFVASGGQVSYQVDVHNFGPNPAATVTLTGQLPGGVTLTSITDDAGGTCTVPPGTSFECDFPVIAAGDVKTVSFLATATGAPYTPLLAAFHVASSTPDSDSSNNTGSVQNYIAAPPVPAATPNPSDSGQLAYNALAAGREDDDVFVQRADGTGLTNLTNNPNEEDSYTWSPDGSRIAFLRYDFDTLTVSLCVMDAGGSNLRVLTNVAGEYLYSPVWSPDGTRLAFGASAYAAGVTTAEVFTINADGTGRVSLSGAEGFNGSPAWSPDGSRISYVRTHFSSEVPPTSEIYIAHADGTNQIVLAHPEGARDEGTEWSPSGARLAFTRNLPDGNTNDIYTVLADGSGLLRLTDDSSLHSATPHWSPNGSRLSFTNLNPNGGPALETVNADGSGRLGLYIPPDDGWNYSVAGETWSPDGTKLAFQFNASRLGPGGGQRGNVCIADANGAGLQCVGDDLDNNQTPAWSPDGQRIAFNTFRNGVSGIDLVNADGTGRVELPGALAGYGLPKWRPAAPVAPPPPPPAPTTCYDLNQLRLGGFASGGAFAFSRSGTVLGQVSGHPFFYDGSMHDLEALLGAGSHVGFNEPGKALSEEGSVLAIGTNDSSSDQYAVLFDATGAHTLTLGGTFSLPVDINDAGQAIGISNLAAAGQQHAFRYDTAR